jgi:hypothetical protein
VKICLELLEFDAVLEDGNGHPRDEAHLSPWSVAQPGVNLTTVIMNPQSNAIPVTEADVIQHSLAEISRYIGLDVPFVEVAKKLFFVMQLFHDVEITVLAAVFNPTEDRTQTLRHPIETPELEENISLGPTKR